MEMIFMVAILIAGVGSRHAHRVADDRRVEVDDDGFQHGVMVHHLHVALASETALFKAAERQAGFEIIIAVDPDHTGFQSSRETMGTRQILRPDTAGEAVFHVIRKPEHLILILPAKYAG